MEQLLLGPACFSNVLSRASNVCMETCTLTSTATLVMTPQLEQLPGPGSGHCQVSEKSEPQSHTPTQRKPSKAIHLKRMCAAGFQLLTLWRRQKYANHQRLGSIAGVGEKGWTGDTGETSSGGVSDTVLVTGTQYRTPTV